MLRVSKLKVSVDGKEILKGVDLLVGSGQVHVLMGPNGSGKSTLAQVIAGHPGYKIESGKLKMENSDLSKLTPDKRAKMGIFLGFQHPVEIPGVSVFNFLRKAKLAGPAGRFLARATSSLQSNLEIKSRKSSNAAGARRGSPAPVTRNSNRDATPRAAQEFREELKKYMGELKLPEDFLRRSLNEGFSGGEKKRNEILQMLALSPKLVILDEIDSGLDVDGLKLVATSIIRFIKVNPESSIILITHYARILKHLKPDFVHVMVSGKIVKSGKMNLAKKIEEKGYEAWQTV